MTFVNSNLSKM